MSGVPRVSPADAHGLVTREAYVFVDVRTEAEFEAGHPEGAFNVPFLLANARGMEPNPDFLRVVRARFPADTKLVVGCRSGGRSLRAATLLAANGYACVVDQRAGWAGIRSPFGEVKEKGWEAMGLPAEEGTPEGRGYADLARG